MKFSQRIGIKSPFKQLQIDSMDNDLRVGLWNSYLNNFFGQISGSIRFGSTSIVDNYISILWHEYFKRPIDDRARNWETNLEYIRKYFFESKWNQVYEFLEFHIDTLFIRQMTFPFHTLIIETNKVLEREFSGYRIIENKFVPISNSLEIKEITDAENVGKSIFNTSFSGVNIHLREALSKLSDKQNPDYRNSIKESISAVEALCRQLTGKSTLGESLNYLDKKGISVNPQIKSSIDKLYAYTNSKDSGIRHALVESPNLPTFSEAKFVLVTCSAFINYLIAQKK